ncbi:MAG: hypothetical protein GYA86_03280 [Firmicutes bacterium]|jgi:hypothetical protein|nr:hypothetical protein [Bacillota bacterium]
MSGPADNLDRLLKEGIRLTGDLLRLEERMQRQLLSLDLQGLAAAVEAGAVLLSRGEQLLEQKRALADTAPLGGMIEQLPEGAERCSCKESCRLLAKRLLAARAGQKVNRQLVQCGSKAILRIKGILSAGRGTYNYRGELRCSGELDSGLDLTC